MKEMAILPRGPSHTWESNGSLNFIFLKMFSYPKNRYIYICIDTHTNISVYLYTHIPTHFIREHEVSFCLYP